MDLSMCYKLCDQWWLPITTIVTFLWTLWQQYQLKGKQNVSKK